MNNNMIDTKDVILALKQVKEEKNLSLDKILEIMTENDPTTAVSKTTLSRVFSAGSEDQLFRYETTLRPIANALLDMETFEPDDSTDKHAYKSILKLKKDIISELENKIKTVESEEREKYRTQLDEEREKFQRSLYFVKNQVELKDKRIDHLLEENMKLVDANMKLLEQLMTCPCRKNNKIEGE